MKLQNLKGKSFTLALSGAEYSIRNTIPELFEGGSNAPGNINNIYVLEVKSDKNYSIRILNDYDNTYTSLDTITTSPRRFTISGIAMHDVLITPSQASQSFYVYTGS